MGDPKPTRQQGDLAEMLDTVLDKGVVVNADVAVAVGDTELLGIKLRAAIASFETAAEYGLEFPSGTDMDRVHDAAGTTPVDRDRSPADLDGPRGGAGDATGVDGDDRRPSGDGSTADGSSPAGSTAEGTTSDGSTTSAEGSDD